MKMALPLAALLLAAVPGAARAGGAAPPAAEVRLRSVQDRRQALQAELDRVAAQIEARKAAARGSALPDGELESLLQRSQVLAEKLAALHREEEAASLARRQDLERQLADTDAAVRKARARGDAPAAARAEAERHRVRAQIDAMEPRAAGPVGLPSTPEDDPDEVREQADLLRDQRDRVMARLRLVEQRLQEAREEEYLARELRDFVDEGALFDDAERVMRASRTVTRSVGRDGDPAPPTEGTGSPGSVTDGAMDGPRGPPDHGGLGGEFPSSTTTSTLVGSRPLGAADLAARGLPSLDGDESVDELVEQQKALRDLAAELERRAGAFDERARRLAAPPAR